MLRKIGASVAAVLLAAGVGITASAPADAAHERLDIPIIAARSDITKVALLEAEGDMLGAERLRRSVHAVATARDWTDLAMRSS